MARDEVDAVDAVPVGEAEEVDDLAEREKKKKSSLSRDVGARVEPKPSAGSGSFRPTERSDHLSDGLKTRGMPVVPEGHGLAPPAPPTGRSAVVFSFSAPVESTFRPPPHATSSARLPRQRLGSATTGRRSTPQYSGCRLWWRWFVPTRTSAVASYCLRLCGRGNVRDAFDFAGSDSILASLLLRRRDLDQRDTVVEKGAEAKATRM